jgi:4-alpha-glucanotransferase
MEQGRIQGLIERLATLRGLGDAYYDYQGELRRFTLETKRDLLAAMGCRLDDPEAIAEEIRRIERQRWGGLLPTVAAASGAKIGFDCNMSAAEFGGTLTWTLHLENGESRSGSVSTMQCPEVWRGDVAGRWMTRRRFELPTDVPQGYHTLEAKIGNGAAHSCRIVMSPPVCDEPPAMRAGGRLWGVAVQLYTVRSRRNWGIGDFADLESLIRWLAPLGAGFIGLNPLHALTPAEPDRASPYSASNRHFLNVLYIAVPEIPEFAGCPAAVARLAEPAFAARLQAVRAPALVDYAAVAQLKFEMLWILYADFRARELAADDPQVVPGTRGASFRAFVAAGGESLRRHALFDALDRHCRETLGTASGWMNWPERFHDPAGPGVAEFAASHATEVQFFLYLQWLADTQLTQAQALARALGMPLGLYGDYAVGANASGSECWSDRETYRLGAEIGAPPDPLALKGQGWGIPPPDPQSMERERLQGFVRLIRANMRYYGALRLDHVMSLFRLWWVAAHRSPLAGAYVHYPVDQLLTIVALESARAHCLVVGEDLGVVPDEIRRAMPQYGVYHYKVVLFEQNAGRFRRPEEYLRQALATVTTHDMPTLRAYWQGLDIDLRERLSLYPSAESLAQVRHERALDRVALLAALQEQGLLPPSDGDGVHAPLPSPPFTPQLAQALHLFLARSNAGLAAVQIDDLLGLVDPVNVPGTSHEYPNWQRKLDTDLEVIVARADLADQLRAIDRARSMPANAARAQST